MRYKISNSASKDTLENFSGIPFRFPKLYQVSPVITGAEETIVPVITQEDQSKIDFGIWGLLPNNYDEDWEIFQNIIDTLIIRHEETKDNALYDNSETLKRCVVLVTGFFTTYLYKGKTYPYYVYQENKKPFYIAGYYNRLEDGFITVTLLLKRVEPEIKKILNLSKHIPKILDEQDKQLWLSDYVEEQTLDILVNSPTPIYLKSHAIAKELFKMNISFDSMLDPVEYEGIPKSQ